MTAQKVPIPNDMKYSFIYGCSLELTCSLHVISDPYHHVNCIDWYDTCMISLEKRLVRKIVDFGERFANWTLIMDLVDNFTKPPSSGSCFYDDFPNFIKRFQELPQEEFAYIFLGETLIGDRQIIETLMKSPEKLDQYPLGDVYKYISRENVLYFISHVDEIRNEIADIMHSYYHSFFKEYWKKTCSFYRGSLLRAEKEFCSSSASSFITSIHDQLSHVDGTLIMKKSLSFQIDYRQIREIRIIFSAFTYPHLMMNVYNDHLTIYRNLLMPIMSGSLDILSDKMKVFSDPTRLTIIKLLINERITNGAISSLLGVTPASVSQHLKILKDAELLIAEKEKNSIFYQINREELNRILKELKNFIQN